MDFRVSSQDEPFKEAHTPRYWYHCSEHPAAGLLRPDDRHFKEAHGGRDGALLRVPCKGAPCASCASLPASQEVQHLGANPAQPTTSAAQPTPCPALQALAASCPARSETSDESSWEEPDSDRPEDISQSSQTIPPLGRHLAGRGTASSARSMAAGRPGRLELDPADEGSGDEVTLAVAAEMQAIMGDVRGLVEGRARHQQAVR